MSNKIKVSISVLRLLCACLAACVLIGAGCGGGGGGGGVTPPPGDAVEGAVIAFYDTNGVEVARATTDVNGNYSVSVPTTARRFHLLPEGLPTSQYYRSYSFQGRVYAPLIDTCRAPLPTLPSGGIITLANISVPKVTGPPPPPPTGCTMPETGTGTVGNATVSGRVLAF
ncbi:MAG TPA: hypothetical protein VM328_10645 [Fimbriimonadaceae bacterium]|nr:hypothetical protein [Fimbriimonadaceae bacterium]